MHSSDFLIEIIQKWEDETSKVRKQHPEFQEAPGTIKSTNSNVVFLLISRRSEIALSSIAESKIMDHNSTFWGSANW